MRQHLAKSKALAGVGALLVVPLNLNMAQVMALAFLRLVNRKNAGGLEKCTIRAVNVPSGITTLHHHLKRRHRKRPSLNLLKIRMNAFLFQVKLFALNRMAVIALKLQRAKIYVGEQEKQAQKLMEMSCKRKRMVILRENQQYLCPMATLPVKRVMILLSIK